MSESTEAALRHLESLCDFKFPSSCCQHTTHHLYICSWKRWEPRNQVSKHFQNSTKKILARTNKSSLVWKFWKTLFKLKCYPTSRAGRGPSSQSLMCSTLEAGILNTPDHFFVHEQSHKNSDGNFFANFWMFSQPPHLLAEWWQSQGEQGTCLWPGLSLNSPMDVYFNTRSVLLRRSSSVSFSSSIPMDISFHARWLPFGKKQLTELMKYGEKKWLKSNFFRYIGGTRGAAGNHWQEKSRFEKTFEKTKKLPSRWWLAQPS